MAKRVYDLVFEGGGAKGVVFVGALEEFFRDGSRTHGRLLGTSAGAITSMLLAAGYTPSELLEVLIEKDEKGQPVFKGFMESPAPFDDATIEQSSLRQALRNMNLIFVPDALEERVDGWIARGLVSSGTGRHLFSFIERGGWYAADRFLNWLRQKLDSGHFNGAPRKFSGMTLQEFQKATGSDLTIVVADTSGSRILFLNHRTAPDCPVVWAVRMSMSIPFIWQEVEWRSEWGPYYDWNAEKETLVPTTITGHAIVDGGLLSNFPIAMFLSNRVDIEAIVGKNDFSGETSVLGLLIDETLPVEKSAEVTASPSNQARNALGESRTLQRLQRLIDTTTQAHDNMSIALFSKFIARLPAAGYRTTQFDMTPGERVALINAGRKAIEAYFNPPSRTARVRGMVPEGPTIDSIQSPDYLALANLAAGTLLK